MTDSNPFARILADEDCAEKIALVDIETGGFDGATDPLIAIGTGFYDTGADVAETTVFTLTRHQDEETLITDAYSWLNEYDFEALVTYHGEEFDLPFLSDKLDALSLAGTRPSLNYDTHMDLFVPRKQQADRTGRKWPSLEETLEAHEIPRYVTNWEEEELTNTRFGEVLAPKYISALEDGVESVVQPLRETIHEYTVTDIEATAALYEADAGREYTPQYPT